ncbi:MAG: flagella basal body P-ring formation protein FlgA [Stenotrophomonas acidaminiphila]|nr:MAG: flagella basal body P-ring formation protein FlgA [Stenotrophomonas acidaminiphila]
MKPWLLLLLLAAWPFHGMAHEKARVSATDLIEVAEQVLRARSEALSGVFEFVPATGLEDSQLSAGVSARLVAGEVQGQWPRARVGVPVHVYADARKLQSRVVWFTVRRWAQVPVYTRDAQAGEASETLAVTMEKRDIANLEPMLIEGSALPAGLRLNRRVRAGSVVVQGDVERAPPVQRNAKVALNVRQGAVRLRVPAIARHDGELGEPVPVRALSAQHWVTARVSGPHEVTLEN